MSDIKGIIALLNVENATFDLLSKCDFGDNKVLAFNNVNELCRDYERLKLNVAAIISEGEVMDTSGLTLYENIKMRGLHHIPFFLLSENLTKNLAGICLHASVAEVFVKPLVPSLLEKRINFLVKNWASLQKKDDEKTMTLYKTPALKRYFDIFFSGFALLVLSPFILIVLVMMKLESRGPVLYYSLRVGTGYRVFKFYKFRSMYVNVAKITLCDECKAAGGKCRSQLFADDDTWCEKHYLTTKKQKDGAAFFKLKNDPRITKVGAFIRNTSIDELPQLWNVLKGDMSIVGNRPLPLYEAEKLTTDKYALRFLAPAGVTGLWQVEKRGKGEMSEEERLMLDNTYAENHSFWYDIKLILKTIPALFQKENV